MNHNEHNPNDHNQTSDLESSLVIVEQLSTRPDEPAVIAERREESSDGSIGAGDLLFDLPEVPSGLAALLPDPQAVDSISTDSLEFDLDLPDDGLAVASATIGDGLITGSDSLGNGLEAATETLGSDLNLAAEGLGDGLAAVGEATGGLFEALGGLFEVFGDLDFFDIGLDF